MASFLVNIIVHTNQKNNSLYEDVKLNSPILEVL